MKLETELRILSWYQIIGGLIGLWIMIQTVVNSGPLHGIAVLILFATFLLYLFSIASGVILIKYPKAGIMPSKISQFLQILGFAVAGYGFQYASGLKLSIGLDLTEGMLLKFESELSSIKYSWNSDNNDILIFVNIVPLVIIHLLNNIESELEPIHSSLEPTERLA